MENCAYEFGSSSMQDRCESIRVDVISSNTIKVTVEMYVLDSSYKNEVDDNIESIVRSLVYQYDIDYEISIEINHSYCY